MQYAIAGMNSHIEHDLPLAVVDTCTARGLTPGDVHQDYEAVNDVLAQVEEPIRRSFLDEVGREVDDHLGPVVHLLSAWNIDKARDLSWVTVETLWALQRTTLSARPLPRRPGSHSRHDLEDTAHTDHLIQAPDSGPMCRASITPARAEDRAAHGTRSRSSPLAQSSGICHAHHLGSRAEVRTVQDLVACKPHFRPTNGLCDAYAPASEGTFPN